MKGTDHGDGFAGSWPSDCLIPFLDQVMLLRQSRRPRVASARKMRESHVSRTTGKSDEKGTRGRPSGRTAECCHDRGSPEAPPEKNGGRPVGRSARRGLGLRESRGGEEEGEERGCYLPKLGNESKFALSE